MLGHLRTHLSHLDRIAQTIQYNDNSSSQTYPHRSHRSRSIRNHTAQAARRCFRTGDIQRKVSARARVFRESDCSRWNMVCRWPVPEPRILKTSLVLIFCRIAEPHPKAPVRAENEKGDTLRFFPQEGEDPSPIYEGLRTNLPHVSGLLARIMLGVVA
jgi:hypothetical protein